MRRTHLYSMACIGALLIFSVGCDNSFTDGINAFEEDSLNEINAAIYEAAVNDELSKVADNGTDLEGVDAIFSLGWHPFYNPIEEELQIRSDAFAVALNSDSTQERRLRAGKDMGTVTLVFSQGEFELNKRELPNGGVVYNIGKKMHGRKGGFRSGGRGGPESNNQGGFGRGNRGGNQRGLGFGSGNLGGMRPGNHEGNNEPDIDIPFVAGDTYSFTATGSEDFPALTVSITAPQQTLQITSPANDSAINSSEDLKVSWDGGASEGKLVIGLIPVIDRDNNQGSFGRGPRGHRRGSGNHEPPPRYEIETNTGEYTIPAADIQALASDENVTGIIVQVMQMIQQETEQDGKKYVTSIRTGDQVVLILN